MSNQEKSNVSNMDKNSELTPKISHYLENLQANLPEGWKCLAFENAKDVEDIERVRRTGLRLDELDKEISKKIEETRAQAAALVKKTKEKEEKQRQTKNTKVSVANKAREGGR